MARRPITAIKMNAVATKAFSAQDKAEWGAGWNDQ
jgi:hypothetical protein